VATATAAARASSTTFVGMSRPRATQQAREVVAAIEERWRDEVGADRYAVFRDVLRELTDAMDPTPGSQ
jgi:hypothetical protein